MSRDYREVVVHKPWGYEYLMYQNDSVGVWFLHLREGARTSLHCHPRKKTGLILLEGEARVSFLNDCTAVAAPAKLIIRPGLFHSTEAVSAGGLTLIEVETPVDKDDLVRLEDCYGRKEQPYEGAEALGALPADCIRLEPPRGGAPRCYTVPGGRLRMETVRDPRLLRDRPPEEVIAVLEGGLYTRAGDPILGAGDVVGPATLGRLNSESFLPRDTLLLTLAPRR